MEAKMKKKVSLWLEDALAAITFLALVAFAVPTLSLEPVRKPAPVAPAALEAPQLLLPLQCDAWVIQSGDGIATPRARCYTFKSSR